MEARRETELNPPIAFVYNRDVDWTVQRIALKYNEDWPSLPPEAFVGPDRNMGLGGDVVYSRGEIYQPLVKTYDAVVEDSAERECFKPLRVSCAKEHSLGQGT